MSLIFETIHTEGIAQLSYLIGDDGPGTAAVIDPRPDVEVYVEIARKRGLAITHILETHIHADLVSGSRELAERVKTARIHVSVEGGATYDFDHEPIEDGDSFEFGEVTLTARHTPGHTPEHLSYVACETERAPTPWGVFTGDSLFVNSAGRPDLMGHDQAEGLAEQLHDTLYSFFLTLGDDVIIYPGHGQGSPCGADIGDRLTSTIGYERRFNPFLQLPDKAAFKDYVLSTAPPEPTYYKRMKRINAAGPEVLGCLPVLRGLSPAAFKASVDSDDVVVVDTRSMLAFGGGHIAGALSIGGSPELSIWAGWLLDPGTPALLVLDRDEDGPEVVSLLLRIGFTNVAGYLLGGMTAWAEAGFELAAIDQIDVHELKAHADDLAILDVRSPDEWRQGRIPGAEHVFLPEVQTRWSEIDRRKPVAVYCNSGYRASVASSILKAEGFDVRNVPGSWQSWVGAGFPVEPVTKEGEAQ